jgi:inosine-uridine nucleoside N-ribohydrolase
MVSKNGKGRMTRREFAAASAAGLTLGSRLAAGRPAQAAAGAGPEKPTASDPARVIIDTDPGVDDALALLLAMRSPELKIEGITPVAGNVPLDLTLSNALRMVEIAGRKDIPVAAGLPAPLLRRLVTAEYAHGENGLDGAVFPEPTLRPIAERAPEFIRRVVRAHPGEVTLLTIGPLSNVAAALRSDPELAKMVRGITMMGGSLSGGNVTPAAEFNVYVDPEAARIVFQSGIPITMVGLDVTRKTMVSEEHVRTLEAHSNPVSQAAAKIARHLLEHARKEGFIAGPNMHDPLAVSSFLDPSLVKLEKFYVDVETFGEMTAGETLGYSPVWGHLRRRPSMEHVDMTFPLRGSSPSLARLTTSPVVRDHWIPNANVAVDVDTSGFYKLLIGRLAGTA